MRYNRGAVVINEDPYKEGHTYRPFLIVSSDDYEPNGYLGVPLTTRKKTHTIELTNYDIDTVYEEFEHDDNFVNPCSPVQVNDPKGVLCQVSEDFVDMIAESTAESMGLDL